MNRREKIFSIIIFVMMIFFCGQDNFANAQDVYAVNTGGLDFYVDTTTISPDGSLGNNIYWSFYVKVKNIPVDSNHIAKNILGICKRYDKRIMQ